MKRTAAVMLLIILLAAGCADAEAGKPIFEMTPAAVTAAPTPEPTIFEIRAYRKYVL